MPESVTEIADALKRVWRRNLKKQPPTISAADLESYAAQAAAVAVDGSEVINVSHDGGATGGQFAYPKQAVMKAAMDLLDEIDGNPSGNVLHSDLSFTRIET